MGGSIVIAIPPQMLDEVGLHEGDVATLRSRPGPIEIQPGAEVSAEFAGWLHRVMRKRDAAWRELADR